MRNSDRGTRRRAAKAGGARNSLALHRARCRICKHPDRDEIEREFLDWASPREIAKEWKIASYRAIYRHAHAVGLFERRRKNWLGALERIIERVSEVQVTASAVVAAVRLSVQIERERNEAERKRPEQRLRLSLDGLPRTDAVTGLRRPVAQASHCAAPVPVARAALKPTPRDDGRGDPFDSLLSLRAGRAATDRGRPSGSPLQTAKAAPLEAKGASPGARTSRQQAEMQEHRLKPAPPKAQNVCAEPDPRVVLGEDGRVAGMPWPKGRITFARKGRWWRGRDRWLPALDAG